MDSSVEEYGPGSGLLADQAERVSLRGYGGPSTAEEVGQHAQGQLGEDGVTGAQKTTGTSSPGVGDQNSMERQRYGDGQMDFSWQEQGIHTGEAVSPPVIYEVYPDSDVDMEPPHSPEEGPGPVGIAQLGQGSAQGARSSIVEEGPVEVPGGEPGGRAGQAGSEELLVGMEPCVTAVLQEPPNPGGTIGGCTEGAPVVVKEDKPDGIKAEPEGAYRVEGQAVISGEQPVLPSDQLQGPCLTDSGLPADPCINNEQPPLTQPDGAKPGQPGQSLLVNSPLTMTKQETDVPCSPPATGQRVPGKEVGDGHLLAEIKAAAAKGTEGLAECINILFKRNTRGKPTKETREAVLEIQQACPVEVRILNHTDEVISRDVNLAEVELDTFSSEEESDEETDDAAQDAQGVPSTPGVQSGLMGAEPSGANATDLAGTGPLVDDGPIEKVQELPAPVQADEKSSIAKDHVPSTPPVNVPLPSPVGLPLQVVSKDESDEPATTAGKVGDEQDGSNGVRPTARTSASTVRHSAPTTGTHVPAASPVTNHEKGPHTSLVKHAMDPVDDVSLSERATNGCHTQRIRGPRGLFPAPLGSKEKAPPPADLPSSEEQSGGTSDHTAIPPDPIPGGVKGPAGDALHGQAGDSDGGGLRFRPRRASARTKRYCPSPSDSSDIEEEPHELQARGRAKRRAVMKQAREPVDSNGDDASLDPLKVDSVNAKGKRVRVDRDGSQAEMASDQGPGGASVPVKEVANAAPKRRQPRSCKQSPLQVNLVVKSPAALRTPGTIKKLKADRDGAEGLEGVAVAGVGAGKEPPGAAGPRRMGTRRNEVLGVRERVDITDLGPGQSTGHHDKIFDEEENQITTSCHQCQQQHVANRCKMDGCAASYCDRCVRSKYAPLTLEEVGDMCPRCRRICSCRKCMRFGLKSLRVTPPTSKESLCYYTYLLASVAPFVENLLEEGAAELREVPGGEGQVQREKLADDRLDCNRCATSIFDIHRACPSCDWTWCPECCREMRQVGQLQGSSWAEGKCPNPSCECSESCVRCLYSPKERETLQKLSTLFRGYHHPDLFDAHTWRVEFASKGDAEKEERVCRELHKLLTVAEGPIKTSRRSTGLKDDSISKYGQSHGTDLPADGTLTKDGLLWVWGQKLRLEDVRKVSGRSSGDQNYMFTPHIRDLKKDSPRYLETTRLVIQRYSLGEPVVVRGCKGTMDWHPQTMMRATREKGNKGYKFEEREPFTVIDCTDWSIVDGVTEYQFFKGFTNPEYRQGRVWKVKDWPPEEHVNDRLKRHAQDYLEMLPLPMYTLPERGLAPLNLATLQPKGTNTTDLGPKTYIAYGHIPESETEGDSVTKLHEDLSEAVNVVTYAQYDGGDEKKIRVRCGPMEPDKPTYGYAAAVWDICRRKDRPVLREFLSEHVGDFQHEGQVLTSDKVGDMIFSQQFMLTQRHRNCLKEEKNVEMWHFEQYPDEVVFIPAGCPHQVRNLRPCIKVAVDFVSPMALEEVLCMIRELRAAELRREVPLEQQNEPWTRPFYERLQAKRIIMNGALTAYQELRRIVKA